MHYNIIFPLKSPTFFNTQSTGFLFSSALNTIVLNPSPSFSTSCEYGCNQPCEQVGKEYSHNAQANIHHTEQLDLVILHFQIASHLWQAKRSLISYLCCTPCFITTKWLQLRRQDHVHWHVAAHTCTLRCGDGCVQSVVPGQAVCLHAKAILRIAR